MIARNLQKRLYGLGLAIACMALAGPAAAQEAQQSCQNGWEALGEGKNMLAVMELTFCIDEAVAMPAADLSRAHLLRGMAQQRMGYLPQAFRDFDEAVRLDPGNVEAFYQRGYLHSGTDDPEAAIRDYSAAIRLDPSFILALNNRCWVFNTMRQPEKALPDCNEAIRQAPDAAFLYDSRAFAYWLKNEQDNARQDLERARKIDPSFPGWQERFQHYEELF